MAWMQTATQTGVGSTRWFKLNPHAATFNVTVQVGFGGGTGNAQVEVTLDETDSTVGKGYNGPLAGGATFVSPVAVMALGTSASSSDGIVNITYPVSAVRVTVNSGSAAVVVRVIQSGVT